MTYNWWPVSEQIGKERHLVGMDCNLVDIPNLFRTKKAADAFIADWKRESPVVKTWGLKAVRIPITYPPEGKGSGSV